MWDVWNQPLKGTGTEPEEMDTSMQLCYKCGIQSVFCIHRSDSSVQYPDARCSRLMRSTFFRLASLAFPPGAAAASSHVDMLHACICWFRCCTCPRCRKERSRRQISSEICFISLPACPPGRISTKAICLQDQKAQVNSSMCNPLTRPALGSHLCNTQPCPA